MADKVSKPVQVRISSDGMEAFIKLERPPEGEKLEVKDVMEELERNGINTGINEETVRDMVRTEMFHIERRVAVGVPPQDGVDGYYIYNYERELNAKPIILDDGSVDYWNCNSIAIVEKDDVIAEYVPAEPGENGVNVRGLPVPCKRGKELLPLKGRGFSRSEDGRKYTADITGKIEESGGRIIISNVYEIRGDVDLSVGCIDFSGDVLIHGAVRDGISIKATGSITVDGIVEGAYLECGGDIILKSGLLGNSKAEIYTRGNLIAKFIEFARVEAEGTIQAETFMESEVVCNSSIILDGTRSKIIGGFTSAVESIEANIIGNAVGVQTLIKVGVDQELKVHMDEIRKRIMDTEANLRRVEQGIAIIEKQEQTQLATFDDLKTKKMQLLRVKIRDTSDLSADKVELEHLEFLEKKSKNARIVVKDTIFAGTRIMIGDYVSEIKNNDVRITYMPNDEDACIRAFRS
ncbi:MAG: FapA family protein [Eubacterium sp.]|nr:FapA family protein [Eubacterium sp.]